MLRFAALTTIYGRQAAIEDELAISPSRRFRGTRLSRQREIERRAVIDLAVRPDAPTMPRDDAMHECEADTIARKFARTVQTLEYAE